MALIILIIPYSAELLLLLKESPAELDSGECIARSQARRLIARRSGSGEAEVITLTQEL